MASLSELVRQFLLEADWDRRRQIVLAHPALLAADAAAELFVTSHREQRVTDAAAAAAALELARTIGVGQAFDRIAAVRRLQGEAATDPTRIPVLEAEYVQILRDLQLEYHISF